MNENINTTLNEVDTSKMSVTERCRYNTNAPADSEKETEQNITAEETATAETVTATKGKKSRNSKRKRESRRTSISNRLEQLITFTEKHDEQNAKLHEEIDTLKKELRDMEMQDIDALCKSRGFTSEQLINYLRTSADVNAIINAADITNEQGADRKD